jgi:hypothetical protein
VGGWAESMDRPAARTERTENRESMHEAGACIDVIAIDG